MSLTVNFCPYCGAGIPHIYGEGTCEKCDREGVKQNKILLREEKQQEDERGTTELSYATQPRNLSR